MPHTDSADIVIAAAPEAVFAALVDADARAAWLPPTGMTGRFEWFDARTGGGYRMVLTYDDTSVVGKSEENTDVAEVRFAAVQAPHRVVEEVDFVSDDPRFTGTMTMTWAVEAVDGGARVTVTATDVPDGISSADHAAAFASTLANLDAHVRGAG
ncbi:SRPBCC domain-containing protein [Pseudonocardia humida]|uniref:SRPBCC domain-containing protein n=1 Tax=Pseudonocardia humida TaxID=2800819 RepID=A0ABT0ZU20_9PSEU|nr:SRPBCC domain-containing protein [Pseudonocardia humida]MCO1654164.1 SRPBCC domain-containing protein [Pseudonocardia humida]